MVLSALAERLDGQLGPARVAEFAKILDSPRRVIVEITPGLRVGYDGDKMQAATKEARAAEEPVSDGNEGAPR